MLFKKNRGSDTPPLSPISRTDSIPTSDNDNINRLNRYDNNNGAIHYPSPPTSSGAKNYKRRIFPPSMHVMEQHHTVVPSRSSGVTITRKTLYVVTFLSFGSFVVLHTLYWNSVIVAITSDPNHQKNYDRISSNNRRILVSSDARITTKRKDASPHSPTFGGYSNPGQYETASFENDHSNDEPSKHSLTSSIQQEYISDSEEIRYHRKDDTKQQQQLQFRKATTTANNDENDVSKLPMASSSISITEINQMNFNGHYWHDLFHSPYSTALLQKNNDKNTTTKDASNNGGGVNESTTKSHNEYTSNRIYQMKLQNVSKTYGQWNTSKLLSLLSSSDEQQRNDTTTTLTNGAKDSTADVMKTTTGTTTTSWHSNAKYVQEFLHQSKQLIHRVKEGIYTEYGMSLLNNDNSNADRIERIKQRRFETFGVHIINSNDTTTIVQTETYGTAINGTTNQRIQCGSYMNQVGWDGLVRKLLHSIIVEDEFYVTVLGNANTYRGNNMFQTQIMQYNYIMEPVFDKLGIQLISRNMGMDTMSAPILNSLGGTDIYGESDILWYIPDDSNKRRRRRSSTTTDKGKDDYDGSNSIGSYDLLHIQSILSGQKRIPVLLTPNPGTLGSVLQDVVWMGNIQPGIDVCRNNNLDVCKYVDCTDDDYGNNDYGNNDSIDIDDVELTTNSSSGNSSASTQQTQTTRRTAINPKSRCTEQQYNSVCWIERSDWNPEKPQNDNVGYQNDGYHNPNRHLLESRKLAMFVLHALEEAIERWVDQLEYNRNDNDISSSPMPDEENTDDNMSNATAAMKQYIPDAELWRVDEVYATIRESVRNIQPTACDDLLQRISPKICHIQMHANTEWTPRILPSARRIKSLIEGDVADYSTNFYELYEGIDVLPPIWKLNDDQVDVHMIAIAADPIELAGHMNSHPNPQPISVAMSSINDRIDDDHWISEINKGDVEWEYDRSDDTNKRIDEKSRYRSLTDYHSGTALSSRADEDVVATPGSLRAGRRGVPRHQLRTVASHKKTMWTVLEAPIGYCDGSSQSQCNRAIGNKCLLSNYNHYKAGIMGHGDSGPLKLNIPNVHHGIILVRFEWHHDGYMAMEHLPDDFQFIYSIDKKRRTILSKSEFIQMGVVLSDDVVIHPLMTHLPDNFFFIKDMKNPNWTIELAIEIRTSHATDASILLTHLYYA